MQLIEVDGKSLLRRHGIPVPLGALYDPITDELPDGPDHVMLKAQSIAGGRGKAGLVRRVERSHLRAQALALRETLLSQGQDVPLLVEDALDYEGEFYAAIRVHDVLARPVVLFSLAGGVKVESSPQEVRCFPVDPLRGLYPHDLVEMLRSAGLQPALLGPISRFLARLYAIFEAEDATLIEINPFAMVAGQPMALDAKVELDDSAAPRHIEPNQWRSHAIARCSGPEIEARAAGCGVTFVTLPGEVALLTGGAGLGMAIADELADQGLMPANFIDAPGGMALEKKIDFVFERARDPEVKAIGVYLMHTAQPLSRVVGRLLSTLDGEPSPKPMVVGLVAAAAGERGLSVSEAKALFSAKGIPVVSEIHEFVEALRGVIGR